MAWEDSGFVLQSHRVLPMEGPQLLSSATPSFTEEEGDHDFLKSHSKFMAEARQDPGPLTVVLQYHCPRAIS